MSVNLQIWGTLVADLVRHRCSTIDAPLTLCANVIPPHNARNPQGIVRIELEFLPYEIIGGNKDGEERDNGFACDLSSLQEIFPGTKIAINYTPNSHRGRGEITITGKICGLDSILLLKLWANGDQIPEYQYNEETRESIQLSEEERRLRAQNTHEMMDEDNDEDDDEVPRH